MVSDFWRRVFTASAVVVAVMMAVSAEARADDNFAFMSGPTLYKMCSAEVGTGRELACIAYVEGINDAMATTALFGQHKCLLGVEPDQVVDVVKKYLGAHPVPRDSVAASLVAHALAPL